MLKLSKTQLGVLGADAESQFHMTLLRQLRDDYPEQTRSWTDVVLLEEIRAVHERAKAYGLMSTPAICQFISLRIAFDARFYDEPHIDTFLKKEPLKVEERFSMLLDVIIKQLQMGASKKKE